MLPGADLRIRTSSPGRSARFDWEDGETRVNVGFVAAGDDKSRVALLHDRLPDADSATEMKSRWRDRLAALKSQLERGETSV
ncbi:MAG: hypothetical protein ACXVUL_20740 [Solirubrobacteraceae bacterium]